MSHTQSGTVAPTMVKRRVSNDLFSDDEYMIGPSARKPGNASSKTKLRPAKKSKKTSADVDSPDEFNNSDIASQSYPHASSTHTISAPKLLRVALLVWYAGVHETRGMPWRKPYDSSLERDERAQRAYEVCVLLFHRFVDVR